MHHILLEIKTKLHDSSLCNARLILQQKETIDLAIIQDCSLNVAGFFRDFWNGYYQSENQQKLYSRSDF